MYSGFIQHILNEGIDLSLPVEAGKNKAFHTPAATSEPFRAGGFTGSVAEGGSANCYMMTFCPHTHGTHTESIGHLTPELIPVHKILTRPFHFAALITCPPIIENGDQIIQKLQIQNAFESSEISEGFHLWAHEPVTACIIRTGIQYDKTHDFSGSHPPYFSSDALAYLREKNILHLLTDLPSVDREDDGGQLSAHKSFWNYPESPRREATITELIHVPQEVEDGIYLLGIHVAPMMMDAAPSKPVIYKIR